MALLGAASSVSAHSEPERANPPINGSVPTAPGQVEIWFSDEVRADGTTIQVIGPGGIQVDQGDATVDLQDPERKHVTVSLRSGLAAGTYTVKWVSMSGADGEEARGEYAFHVGAATPAASPAATPVGAVAGPSAATPTTNSAPEGGYFDSQAFGVSVGVGIVAAVLIFLFWRLVRPKNPVFRD